MRHRWGYFFKVTGFYLRFWMLWVLGILLTVLFLVTCFLWIVLDNLRAGYTQYGFTGVRETTSLEGEGAHLDAYSLPFQRFSLALSFPHHPHSWGNGRGWSVLTILSVRLCLLWFCVFGDLFLLSCSG